LAWRIEFNPQTEKDFKELNQSERKRLFNFLKERVALLEDPRNIGEALSGKELGHFWKYRVGDYRLICEIRDQEIVILVVRIGHRRDVYKR
jgi:mRNA interferase RelE/StbE